VLSNRKRLSKVVDNRERIVEPVFLEDDLSRAVVRRYACSTETGMWEITPDKIPYSSFRGFTGSSAFANSLKIRFCLLFQPKLQPNFPGFCTYLHVLTGAWQFPYPV